MIENYAAKCKITAKGYITVEVLRQILHEIDDKITPGDLDLMIEEIDADGSGLLNEFSFVVSHSIHLFFKTKSLVFVSRHRHS